MSTATATLSLKEIAARWRSARRIYPVYATIVRQFDIGTGPCRDLESPIDRNDIEVLERIDQWFDRVDEGSDASHLRRALQMSHVATEDNLRGLLRRLLGKQNKSASDRDKVDFLLVQYFSDRAPHAMHNRPLELDDVAEVLEPVLGETVPHQPKWLDGLDHQLAALGECRSLGDLLERHILSDVRQLKEEAGDMYFGTGALLSFTRFNFTARHAFFRLLHSEVQGMRHALNEIESRGVQSLDCTRAGLSDNEPVATVKRICHDWKTPFHAPYAAGKTFEQLIAIKHILDGEAAKPTPLVAAAEPEPQAPPEVPTESVPEPSMGDPVEQTDATDEITSEESQSAPPVTEEVPSLPQPVVDTVETALPAETPATHDPVDLQACLEHIAEQLIGDVQPHPTAVATVFYNDSKVLMSSWEVAAFVKGGNDVADTLQRAVAARTLLLDAVERKKKGIAAPDLDEATKVSHAELATMQERIAEAKEAKNIDAAVNLAATCKRLLSLIDEAEKLRS